MPNNCLTNRIKTGQLSHWPTFNITKLKAMTFRHTSPAMGHGWTTTDQRQRWNPCIKQFHITCNGEFKKKKKLSAKERWWQHLFWDIHHITVGDFTPHGLMITKLLIRCHYNTIRKQSDTGGLIWSHKVYCYCTITKGHVLLTPSLLCWNMALGMCSPLTTQP